jgi:hypothetical protein
MLGTTKEKKFSVFAAEFDLQLTYFREISYPIVTVDTVSTLFTCNFYNGLLLAVLRYRVVDRLFLQSLRLLSMV